MQCAASPALAVHSENPEGARCLLLHIRRRRRKQIYERRQCTVGNDRDLVQICGTIITRLASCGGNAIARLLRR
jgi:hypothetical protein